METLWRGLSLSMSISVYVLMTGLWTTHIALLDHHAAGASEHCGWSVSVCV